MRKNRGFTLLEIILSIVVVALVIGVIYLFMQVRRVDTNGKELTTYVTDLRTNWQNYVPHLTPCTSPGVPPGCGDPPPNPPPPPTWD